MADSLVAEIGISKRTLERCRSLLRTADCPQSSPETAVTDAEASAISLVCFTETMLSSSEHYEDDLRHHTIAISGSGKLAIATGLRAMELDANVISLSDRNGTLIHRTGFTVDHMTAAQTAKQNQTSLAIALRPLVASGEAKYYPQEKPWQRAQGATIALPCAVENEIDVADAEALIEQGVRFVLEGSTMSCTPAAMDAFQKCHLREGRHRVCYAPS